MSAINLHNGDSLAAMRLMPDNAYGLAIVDPPYGIGWDGENSMAENNSKKWSGAKKKGYEQKEWDSDRPTPEYFAELRRVSIKQIIWGGNYFADILPPSGGWVVWEKGVPDNMTLSQAELAWTNALQSVRVTKHLWAGFRKCEDVDRIHPTQKPVALYKWLLSTYAKEGDRILDTHLGSGSIAIACHDAGFDLDGWELDADYYEAACARLAKHKQQQQFAF